MTFFPLMALNFNFICALTSAEPTNFGSNIKVFPPFEFGGNVPLTIDFKLSSYIKK
jgi:hypothetical protein